MSNRDLIEKFYSSLASGNAEGMISVYADDIHFNDPAFGDLYGDDAKDMWRMLLKNSKGDLKISYGEIQADEKTGSANWIARYNFSKTGRRVVNKISSRFEFKEGKIIRHTDSFDLWKWTRQALGLSGYLLGWSPFMKSKIQKQTRILLEKFRGSKM